ncbi:MAG: ABC transporter ATP-binding protein [Asgard group archaeon]|nr:ABC transporter ATP-binding protein [Asgard group archaeon]
MTKESIIELQNVYFKYRSLASLAIENISMEVQAGDFVLIAGYSGSGKSTLLKCINGLIPHFHAGSFGGKVTVFGKNTLETQPSLLAEKIGFVFQNPENQISNTTVEREIAFPMENFAVPIEQMKDRIAELLHLFNIEDLRKKSPFELSGGEQQLVAIASALALNPSVLILDEATAHLAPDNALKLLEFLHILNKKHGKTIILSEHRLDHCLPYATKLGFMKEGKLIIYNDVRTVLNSNDLLPLLPTIPWLYHQIMLKKEIDTSQYLVKNSPPITIKEFSILLQRLTESDRI